MKFAILGNQNAITYKEVFPYIKENIIWLGASIHSGGVDFQMPDNLPTYSKNVFLKDGKHFINLAGIRWFTNVDFYQRHEWINCMTMVKREEIFYLPAEQCIIIKPGKAAIIDEKYSSKRAG